MPIDVERVIEALKTERPLFHSEADFQHEFAWTLRQLHSEVSIRLERRFDLDDGRVDLDVLVLSTDETVAIELKYKTATFTHEHRGEQFVLRNQGAQDIGRYDIVKDVSRVERLVLAGAVSRGFAIVLTNDRSLWTPGRGGLTADSAFRLHEGVRLGPGALAWSERAGPGTRKDREDPIVLRGTYEPRWRPYSALGDGACEFRHVIFAAHADRPTVGPPTSPPAVVTTPASGDLAAASRRGKYGPLHEHLKTRQDRRWSTTLPEIERIIGAQLPPSARAQRTWWANTTNETHAHAKAWLSAGWRVVDVDTASGTVRFERA
ncbi:MAG: hypothetical protein KIT58_04725 [Planctomycetota bacterium]|nr:hypothetical protein [Planctomycetota bacterium]